MKRLIIRIENHWRVWRTTRRQLIHITVLGVTLLNIRLGSKHLGIEVLNIDFMVYRDYGDTNTKDPQDTV